MSSEKRTGSDDEYHHRSANGLLAVETVRSSSRLADDAEPRTRRTDEERMSLFWRVFGGTMVSVAALVGITIYNNLSGTLSELRGEVSRLNEAKAEAAKKDELNTLRTQVATYAEYRREIDSLKERASKYRTELEEVKKEAGAAVETARKEQGATNDTIKKDVAALEMQKERLAGVTADLKAAREEGQKLRADLDRVKMLDETVKELQKNLLEAREKIARLEGQQGPPKPAAAEPTKPSVSAPMSKTKANSGPRPVTPGLSREEK